MFNWTRYKTDKYDHGYDILYDKYFNNLRNSTGNILEIGSRQGSTVLWKDYFPNATIISADIKEHITYEFERAWDIPNTVGRKFNQSSVEDHIKLIEDFTNFDIIVDDGPHTSFEQLLSLQLLFPVLNKGGIFVIEDLHCTDFDTDPEAFGFNFVVTIQEVLKDFQNSIFTSYDSINFTNFSEFNFDINIERTNKKRWPHQHKPTEIAFLIKK